MDRAGFLCSYWFYVLEKKTANQMKYVLKINSLTCSSSIGTRPFLYYSTVYNCFTVFD